MRNTYIDRQLISKIPTTYLSFFKTVLVKIFLPRFLMSVICVCDSYEIYKEDKIARVNKDVSNSILLRNMIDKIKITEVFSAT